MCVPDQVACTSSNNNASLTHVVWRHLLTDRSERNRRPVLPLFLGTDLECADTASRIKLNFPDVCREGTSGIRHHTQRWKRRAKPRSAAHCSPALRRSAPELVPRGRLFVPLIQRLSPGEHRVMVFQVKAVRHLHFGDTQLHIRCVCRSKTLAQPCPIQKGSEGAPSQQSQ